MRDTDQKHITYVCILPLNYYIDPATSKNKSFTTSTSNLQKINQVDPIIHFMKNK